MTSTALPGMRAGQGSPAEAADARRDPSALPAAADGRRDGDGRGDAVRVGDADGRGEARAPGEAGGRAGGRDARGRAGGRDGRSGGRAGRADGRDGRREAAAATAKRGAGLSSVRNAARLLTAFTPADRDLGVSELAGRLGIAKSTVHRLLSTLALEGLVERDAPTGRYRLGLRLYELGSIVADHLDLHDVVAGPLDDLRNRTGETVHVAILDGAEVVYVARRESQHTLRLFGRVGHRNHAHCTSTGKVLLAFLSEPERAQALDGHELAAHTPFTIVDRDRLEVELEAIRRRGWGDNVNESEMGVTSVAAPIRDATGKVVAAISVAGPGPRMTAETTRRFASETVRAADAISSRLGYRPRESGLRLRAMSR